MIHLVIVWCMVLNPTMCKKVEVVPTDRAMTSIMDCLMGGVIYTATNDQGIEWRYEIHCEQSTPDPDIQLWLGEEKRAITHEPDRTP